MIIELTIKELKELASNNWNYISEEERELVRRNYLNRGKDYLKDVS